MRRAARLLRTRQGLARHRARQFTYDVSDVVAICRPPSMLEAIRPEVEEWIRQEYPRVGNAQVYYSGRDLLLYSIDTDGKGWAVPREVLPPHFGDPRDLPGRKTLEPLTDCVLWA
jgi:hypothetical protein